MCIYSSLLKLLKDFRVRHPEAFSIKSELYDDGSGQIIVEGNKSNLSIIWANEAELKTTLVNYGLSN